MAHNPKLRFGLSLEEATGASRFNPSLGNAPALPIVNFAVVGATAPKLVDTAAGQLPKAAAIVICWTDAEWAALQHVFCGGSTVLAYSARTHGTWPGWQTWASDLPKEPPTGWDHWGLYRLVEIQGRPVLLLKSNTHLDYPGAAYLEQMIELVIAKTGCTLVMSTGTAGGAKTTDHVGTVRAVSAGTLYQPANPPKQWPVYASKWTADDTLLSKPGFKQMLNPVPATTAAIETLVGQYNQHFGSTYRRSDLDPLSLNIADAVPAWFDQTGGTASLLTTPTFVVATTSGNLADYTAVEMDDALIAKACGTKASFAFVRNVSDPAQGADLPTSAQKNWGSAVYDVFGFYTSFNGALVAWAMLS